MTAENAEPERADNRPLVRTRSVDIVVSLLLLSVAALLGWDSWRIRAGWASDGPQAGPYDGNPVGAA
ncbi:MAG: hypothetical protein ACLPKB_34715 [Xanthobacteraceae bacterium]